MADKNSFHIIYNNEKNGQVQIMDEVLDTIAAVAATEVEGVASLRGNLTAEQITKGGSKNLSRSVKIQSEDNNLVVHLVLNIRFGYSVPEVSKAVQAKVKESLQNMTGLSVSAVHVSIAEVQMEEAPKKKTMKKPAREA